MLVKLTHRGKPTIMNVNQIVSMYMDTDLRTDEFKLKITTMNGIVFVDEDIKEVHRKINEALKGALDDEYDYSVPTIDDRIGNTFSKESDTFKKQYGTRKRINERTEEYRY